MSQVNEVPINEPCMHPQKIAKSVWQKIVLGTIPAPFAVGVWEDLEICAFAFSLLNITFYSFFSSSGRLVEAAGRACRKAIEIKHAS